MGARNHSGLLVLTAVSLVSAALGSIHAFSVFLQPLETTFGASRALASLTYSFALLCLTAAVLWGHALYAKTTAARFVLGTSILAALGVWQLQRHHWKQDVLARIEAKIGGTPMPLPEQPTEAAFAASSVTDLYGIRSTQRVTGDQRRGQSTLSLRFFPKGRNNL